MDVDILEVLSSKFPDMQPICSAPDMRTVNGIGTKLYGERDRDSETGAYISTLCFCIVFIPVYAISSYVVTDGKGGGWHFFGSVPLSQTAKDRNKVSILCFLALIMSIAAGAFFSSSGWRAYGQLKEARSQAASGDWKRAGQTYELVASSGTWASSMAQSDLENHVLGKLEKKDLVGLAEPAQALLASHLMEKTINTEGQALKDKLVGLAVSKIETQPVETALVLSVVMSYSAPEDRKSFEYPFAVSLQNAIEKDEERVIAFCDQQFGRFKSLMEAFNKAFAAGVDYYIDILEHGQRRDFDYQRFKASDDATKKAMIKQWVTPKVLELENVIRLRFSVALAGAACGLALDCTTLLYKQVEELPEEDLKRIRTIRRCQHLFGTVGEYIDDVPTYMVQYAEVCHLMGKQKRAQQVFSQIINDRETTAEQLVEVAQAKNSLDLKADARRLAERAYGRAETKEERSQAAGVRADATENLEDALAWLKRCDPDDQSRKAQLYNVLAKVARKQGKSKESATHFRKAFDLLKKDEKDFFGGLKACTAIYDLCDTTYLRKDFDEAFSFVEETAKKMPKFLAVQILYVRMLQTRALFTVIGDELDFPLMRQLPRQEHLEFIVRRQKDRDKRLARLAENEDWKSAVTVLKRLAEDNPSLIIVWRWLYHTLNLVRDKEAFSELLEKLEAIRPRKEKKKADIVELEDLLLKKDEPEEGKAPRTLRVKGKGRKADAARALAVRESKLPIDTRIRLARKLVSRSPSQFTLELYLDLLFEKTHESLLKSSSAYKRAIKPGLKHLSPLQQLALGLVSSRASMSVVEGDASFKKARKLLKKFLKGFPNAYLPVSWIFLRRAHKDEAKKLAARLKDDKIKQMSQKTELLLYGHLDTSIFNHYLESMAIGDREAARKFGGKLRQRGYAVQVPGKGK